MTSPGPGLFRPRKFSADGSAWAKRSFLADSTTDGTFASAFSHRATELTKNDRYCVTRLPALPAVLAGQHEPDTLNAYADNATKCALVIGKDTITVWPYNSTDDVPLTFEFPLGQQNALQLAILTAPAPGASVDPGLVIVDSILGHVRFYESVQHAPALGMINDKLIEAQIELSADLGEYITLAENVEPLGIVVATSWKRAVLVTLRLATGTPRVATLELTRPSRSTRMLSRLWGSSRHDSGELADDIVLIRAGRVSNQGLTQEIVVQDASGTFKKFVCQPTAAGVPFINHNRTLLHRLSTYLENNIDGLFPGSVFDVKFLDLWPLAPESDSLADVYIALVCAKSSIYGVDQERLLLITISINESGVMVRRSHQLPEIKLGALKPKLFIPKPGKTAFVVVENSVILTDLASLLQPTAEFQYYEPQWEDVVRLKTSVDVIGYGYESKADNANTALVLITANDGVVKIERFPDSEKSESGESDPTDPFYLLKSRVQQAIYYKGSEFMDFDVSGDYSNELVGDVVEAVIDEILDSSSPYLPAVIPSLRDSLLLRLGILENLIAFVKRNFPESCIFVLPSIVTALEKIQASQNLWVSIDNDSADAKRVKLQLQTIIKAQQFQSESKDVIRSFFAHNVQHTLSVLTKLVDALQNSETNLLFLLSLIVSLLYEGVCLNELKYISNSPEIPPRKLWVFDSDLVFKVEQVFSSTFSESSEIETSSDRSTLIKLMETLYFLVTSAIQYMQDTNDDQLQDYLGWYNLRKSHWLSALLRRGLTSDAMQIAERYHDFSLVASVLDKESEQTSPEYVQEQVDVFMEKYGYEFASKLFDYYIQKDQVKNLLLEDSPHTPFLEEYLEKNPKKSRKIAWIHYVISQDFEHASELLLALAAEQEDGNQENRELSLSLAKLTAIAAKNNNRNPSSSHQLEEIAVEAESNLVVVRIQNRLLHLISQQSQEKSELITLDFFVSNFATGKDASALILPFFSDFVGQKPIKKEHLITLLTSIKPTIQFSDVYIDALKVAAVINNEAEFQRQTKNIWAKLLCTTDDWASLTATSDNSDQVNKAKIRETTIFHTLRLTKAYPELLGVLNEVLETARGAEDPDLKQWTESLTDLERLYSVSSWVATIKSLAVSDFQ